VAHLRAAECCRQYLNTASLAARILYFLPPIPSSIQLISSSQWPPRIRTSRRVAARHNMMLCSIAKSLHPSFYRCKCKIRAFFLMPNNRCDSRSRFATSTARVESATQTAAANRVTARTASCHCKPLLNNPCHICLRDRPPPHRFRRGFVAGSLAQNHWL